MDRIRRKRRKKALKRLVGASSSLKAPKMVSFTQKAQLFFMIILITMIGMVAVFERNMRPTIVTIAQARAKSIATRAINNAVNEKLVNDIQYRDLIIVKTDMNGRIVLMQPNTMQINNLASETALAIQESIRDLSNERIRIPLGRLFGSTLLASYTPSITMKIFPVGTVQVNVKNAFEEAGINQTRHQIYLDVDTRVRVVIPLCSSEVKVNAQAPIADTVIVGEVPDSFMNIPYEIVGNLPF